MRAAMGAMMRRSATRRTGTSDSVDYEVGGYLEMVERVALWMVPINLSYT